jgi:hypothetical protein
MLGMLGGVMGFSLSNGKLPWKPESCDTCICSLLGDSTATGEVGDGTCLNHSGVGFRGGRCGDGCCCCGGGDGGDGGLGGGGDELSAAA